MKKGSMLTALLLAMVMLVSSAFAEMADAMPEGGVADLPVVEENSATDEQPQGTELMLLADYNSDAKVPALYGDLITNYDDLDALYYAVEKACTNNLDLVSAFTVLQVSGVLTRTNDLYEESTAHDKDETREMIHDMLMIATGAIYNEAMVLATGLPSTGGTLAAGTYQLRSNVKLTNNITIAEGTTVEIDLNGYVLEGTGSGSVITNNGTLTITDSNPTTKHYGSLENRTYTFVTGSGTDAVRDDRTASDAIWEYDPSATTGTLIEGGIITGGNVQGSNSKINGGGGIHNKGTVYFQKGTIAGNETISYGGGVISVQNSVFHITGGSIMYNWSFDQTGGIYVYGGTLTMTSGHIDHNACGGTGGGARIDKPTGGPEGTFTMQGGTIDYNRAMGNRSQVGNGGGVYSEYGGSFTFSGGSISYNTAYNRGGGIDFWSSGTFTMNGNCKVIGNVAGYRGGGISIAIYTKSDTTGVQLNINSSEVEISGNKAPFGGGVSIVNGDFNMSAGKVTNNTATMELEVDCADIRPSDTPKGGAVYIENGIANLTGGTLSGNRSYKNGGGLYIQGGVLKVEGTTVNNNHASNYGGAAYVSDLICGEQSGSSLYLADASVTISSGTISGNDADRGGAVYVINRVDKLIASVNKDGEDYFQNGNDLNDKNEYQKDAKDGVAWSDEAKVTVEGGTLSGNTASEYGGAISVELGDFILKGTGKLTGNTATINGGAVYISDGDFTMENGEISSNSAVDGGAAYIHGGDFNMTNGSMIQNTASSDGGALFMDGGNFVMEYGSINSNTANNGGAVYMNGDANTKFYMKSGFMNGNHAKKLANVADINQAGGDGGAIYAVGGTMYIGLKDCTATNHLHPAERTHPEIEGNTADDCGGGIAISKNSDGTQKGTAHFYCGNATTNTALYRGVGLNVFMDGGYFYLYDGAELGTNHEPELVIIGGELHNECEQKVLLDLFYYQNQGDEQPLMHGLAELDEQIILPDGGYFLKKPSEDVSFFGWTALGLGDTTVRNKNQYLNSGTLITIGDNDSLPTFDGKADEDMHLYALWAPSVSKITYVDSMENYQVLSEYEPQSYTLQAGDRFTEIPAIQKPGYAVVGWYIYQDEGQNANWGLEPIYLQGTADAEKDYDKLDYEKLKANNQYLTLDKPGDTLRLNTGTQYFGDITLIAIFEPQFGSLILTKSAENATDAENFIFKITGAPANGSPFADMYVNVKAGQSVTLAELPVGEYVISEELGWSWRYTPDEQTKNAEITGPETPVPVTFTNNKVENKWLDAESIKPNVMTPTTTNSSGNGENN